MDPAERSQDVRRHPPHADAEAAFLAAYEQHHAELMRYVLAWTRDRAAAEDICQEAFVRLYVALRRGRGPEMAGAWLRRVGRNLAIGRARRARVASRHAARLREDGGWDPTSSLVLERERLGHVRAALGRVPPDHRDLLLLAASGYSRAGIGTRLGASAGAVRTRLHRARRLLLNALEADEQVS